MSEISGANWSETDASNNAAVPDGWPEGQVPSSVNNCARATHGAIKRFWDRINPTYTTGGSATAYTLTLTVALSAYVNYELYRIRFHTANTGADPTINISALGAKTIKKYVAGSKTTIAAGDIQGGAAQTLWYDGTHMVLLDPPTGFTNPMTTEGDLIIGGSGGSAGRLAIGSNGQFFTTNGTTASWGALTASSTTASGVVETATQAEMEAETAAKFPDAALINFNPGVAKAWGFATVSGGTPTLQTSRNLTSITDSGQGILGVTIATDFSSANWPSFCLCAGVSTNTRAAQENSSSAKAAGTVSFACNDADGQLQDPVNWNFGGFGDQA